MYIYILYIYIYIFYILTYIYSIYLHIYIIYIFIYNMFYKYYKLYIEIYWYTSTRKFLHKHLRSLVDDCHISFALLNSATTLLTSSSSFFIHSFICRQVTFNFFYSLPEMFFRLEVWLFSELVTFFIHYGIKSYYYYYY